MLAAWARPRCVEASGPGRFAETARRVRELGAARWPTMPAGTRGRRPRGRCSWAGSRSRPTAGRLAGMVVARARHARAARGGLARYGERGAAHRCRSPRGPMTRPTRSSSAVARGSASWRRPRCRCSTPIRSSAARVASAAPPSHYEAAVARAVERIRAGELQKVVLAREVRVHGAEGPRPGAGARRAAGGIPGLLLLLRRARRSSPSSGRARSCWCAATAPAPRPWRWPAPRAAAPTRRWTTTSASSCSGAPRTARSRRSSPGGSSGRWSRSACGWRQPTSPRLVKVQNVQHLATPIRAQLARARAVIELAGLLHPTPAVGGEPRVGRRAADPGARGARPRLVRRRRLGGPTWGRTASSASRCAARSCAAPSRTCTRAAGSSRDSVPADGARGDRGQAPGAAAAARLVMPRLDHLAVERARCPAGPCAPPRARACRTASRSSCAVVAKRCARPASAATRSRSTGAGVAMCCS